eukprot:257695_1
MGAVFSYLSGNENESKAALKPPSTTLEPDHNTPLHCICGSLMEKTFVERIQFSGISDGQYFCCGCKTYSGRFMYQCNKCFIKHVKYDYPKLIRYKYCTECYNKITQTYIDSTPLESSITNNKCKPCICGASWKLKMNRSVVYIGTRNAFSTRLFGDVTIICNKCNKDITSLNMYVTCTNNKHVMNEHPKGYRLCITCFKNHFLCAEPERNKVSIKLFKKFGKNKKASNRNYFNEYWFSDELLYHIFEYATAHYTHLIALSRVNKRFYILLSYKTKMNISNDYEQKLQNNEEITAEMKKKQRKTKLFHINRLWQQVACIQWPYLHLNNDRKLKRWDIFFRIRFDSAKWKENERFEKIKSSDLSGIKRDPWWIKDEDEKFQHEESIRDLEDLIEATSNHNCSTNIHRIMRRGIIENCSVEERYQEKMESKFWDTALPNGYKWNFKCPLFESELKWTGNDTYSCKVCDKNVYVCKDKEELKQRMDNNECASIRVEYFEDKSVDTFKK